MATGFANPNDPTYPGSDKYQNLGAKCDNFKFFGSETFGNRFSEAFSGRADVDYQETEGGVFTEYECNVARPEGYQDLSDEVLPEEEKPKKGKKKKVHYSNACRPNMMLNKN